MRDLVTPTHAHKNGVLHFDLASLRIFIAVADERSITRAALREHMSLSAVSKRVSELEQLVGSALLRRHARGVMLTPTGELLVSYAKQIVQTLQCMRAELSQYTNGTKGRVRVHANTWAITEFLPDELHAFAAMHPEVEVDLEEHGASTIVRAVAEGSADLGIITQTTPALDLHVYPYHADHLVLVVPPTHPLARRRSVRFTDTLDYEYVGYQAESPLRGVDCCRFILSPEHAEPAITATFGEGSDTRRRGSRDSRGALCRRRSPNRSGSQAARPRRRSRRSRKVRAGARA